MNSACCRILTHAFLGCLQFPVSIYVAVSIKAAAEAGMAVGIDIIGNIVFGEPEALLAETAQPNEELTATSDVACHLV